MFRIINADPIDMSNNSNRRFTIKLGRHAGKKWLYNRLRMFQPRQLRVMFIDDDGSTIGTKTVRQLRNDKRVRRLFYKGPLKKYPITGFNATIH